MIFNYSLPTNYQKLIGPKTWSLVLGVCCWVGIMSAQTPHCHADEVLSNHLTINGLEHEIEAYKDELKGMVANRSGGVLAELPVVFHIIHRGEAIGNGPNLTESKILEQLDILNEDFEFLNEDKDFIPNQFEPFAVDTEIQFCLAKVNENGQATSGIIRYELPAINSTTYIEDVVKPQTQWDPTRYINIWILRMPDPGILGYAYLPVNSILGSAQDGIVISHTKVGNQNTITKGRTLVHEMGHYLGLLHLWGFDEPDCDEDDLVSDTPFVLGPYYGCPQYPQFSCGSSDMFINYMDYVNDNCMFMFTQGQKDIMHNTINSKRSSLKANKDAICSGTVSTNNNSTLSNIQLYPNPASEFINLQLNDDYQWISYNIYDISGQLVADNHPILEGKNGIYTVNTAFMESGVYVVRLETKTGESFTKRFVIANE